MSTAVYADLVRMWDELRLVGTRLGMSADRRVLLVLAARDVARAVVAAGGEPRVDLELVRRSELTALAVRVRAGHHTPPLPLLRPPLAAERDAAGDILVLAPLPAGTPHETAAEAGPPVRIAPGAGSPPETQADLMALLALADEREARIQELSRELEETNRGVLALYVELEQRDEQIGRAHRAVFRELEDALRPPPLKVDHVELGVQYRPSQENSPTGGDLYDWLVLPSGELHITVVDVMGHGVTGTRDALNVTHVVRTLALEGHPLATLIQRASVLLEAHDPELIATLLVVRFDPATGVLHAVGGGHPPLLVVNPGEQPAYLDAPGRAIGYPQAGADAVVSARLAPDGVVLLYTDGLIENTRNVIEGLERLSRVVGEDAAVSTEELPAAVIRDVLADGFHADDTLALALRWTPG